MPHNEKLLVSVVVSLHILVACLSQHWYSLHDPAPQLAVLATATDGGPMLYYSAEVICAARATCCSSPHILELCYHVWVVFIAWLFGFVAFPQHMASMFADRCGMRERCLA